MEKYILTETDRMVIYHRVASKLINENILQSFAGSAISALGPNADKILPDSIAVGFKKKIVKSLFQELDIDKGGALSDFIENIIANISIADLGEILAKTMTCERLLEILISATTMSITKLGLKKALVPVVHYFSQYEIGEGFDIKKKKSGKDFKSVTTKQVDQMLDTLIGVLGEALLSKLVEALIKDNLVNAIGDHICSKLNLPRRPTPAPPVATTQAAPAPAFPATPAPTTSSPGPSLRVIPAPPRIGSPSTPAGLPGPVTESQKRIENLLKNSYRKNFTVEEFKKVKIAMEII